MPSRPPSPSPQSRATTTTITATTANRQIWSTVSMSMHHRTSTTTTTAATVLEEEVYGDKPVFSRHSKAESQAGDDPLNSTPIAPTFTSKSSSSLTSSLPPPYSATQQAAPPSSLTPSTKPEEQHTKSSSWRFEIALEGGSCVIRQLGHPAAQAAAPTEREGGAMGILSCVKALFSIVAGTVMAFVGVIVSVVAVLVTRVFPSMAARAPETVARSSSDNAIAGSRKRKLSPAPASSTSSPSIGDRQVLSPSDLSLVGSTSTGLVSSLPTSPLPGIQRHVTFNLEQTKSSGTGSVSSGAGKSRDDIVGLNTPTIATFAPPEDDDEKEVSEMGVVVRAGTTLSSVPATSSGSKKRKSWFMKRRAATLASTGSDVDDSSDAGTIASMTNSAPPTPSTLVTELPPVSEEDAGSGADAGAKEKKDAAKSGRRISLKLQFGGKSWKRRSGSAFVENPAAASGSGNPEEEVNSEMAEATTPSSAVSSNSVPLLPMPPAPPSTNPTVTSKQQKRRSFPFVGSSNTTSIPSTAPIRPTARTNPYGAPYFAAPPTARLTSSSESSEKRRGSYDDAAAAQSDRESAGRHRRTESADGGGGSTRSSTAVRQDSTGSGFSRASSSLTSGTGSESGLGLRSDGSVSEVGELVVQTPPSSPPPQATSSNKKKTTSPYSKPRLPSTLPTSPLSSAAFAAGRVASDSTAVLAQGSQKNQDRKRTSSSSNRPPVVDRHARMRDAALAWASDSEMVSGNASIRVRRGSASVAVRGESRLRE